MNKSESIKTSRKQVGEIYKFGENYRFNYWDESVNSWRESTQRDFFNSVFHRSQELVCRAMELLGFDQDTCFSAMAQYCNGSWTDHLDDMIEKYS